MTFEEFMSALLKPTYVWRMASGINTRDPDDRRPLVRSARTRMDRARQAIDDLVLSRALTIQDERRCAAVSRGDAQARCEYPRGHAPVPGRERSAAGLALRGGDKEWDHGAPSKGVWWREPKEATV